MSTALATVPADQKQLQQQSSIAGELTVQNLVDRKRKILDVMKAVMIEGEHYGKIPGCGDKPTLLKAGAEVLATTFGLTPRFKIEQTDFAGGHREIRITCQLVSIGTDKVIGEGMGSCSTMESKYRWRQGQRVCPACESTALFKSKQKPEWFCWVKKGGCGATFALDDRSITEQSTERVENPDIADVYNTVLKIAKKRAQVDATLTATGASDLLTQDLEDLPAASRGYERRERGQVEDAEYTDVSGGYGETPRGHDHIEGGDAFLKEADRRKQSANTNQSTMDEAIKHGLSALEQHTIEIEEAIEAAESAAAVKTLAPRCNDLPKGSPERARVRAKYDAKIASFTSQQGARS